MADSGDFQWLTYRELADALGITYRAAEARARRNVRSGKWAVRRDNDGARAARVRVPAADLEAARQGTPGNTVEGPAGDTTGLPAGDTASHAFKTLLDEAKALREAVAGLHERAGRAEGEAMALRDALTHERQAREAAERDAEGLRGTLAHERQALAHEREAVEAARLAAETARASAEAERDAARQDAAEWASGSPLARAWRALWWKGGE
jgi:hypothetical protein